MTKDPIEYLKSAHADGDMIDPATMLRECYGITNTERVVVEWSDATKREIKVGDNVRIVGFSNLGYNSIAAPMGSIRTVNEVDITDPRATYFVKDGLWFPASSVERV